MKNKPYSEIMNFNVERKEYVRLCECKSKKYKLYSDWKQHIEECVRKISELDKLEDFKHYCISRKRTTSRTPELFGIYIGLLISYATANIPSIFEPQSHRIALFLFFFVALVLCLFYTVKQHKKVIYESSFFEDILEIVDELVNKK